MTDPLQAFDDFVTRARAAGDPESLWIAEFVEAEANRLREAGGLEA